MSFLSKERFFPLANSTSVISIIHSLHPPNSSLVTALNFDVDHSNNLSSSSEYFKMEELNSQSLVKMGLADNRRESSDNSSLSAQSNITEELTMDVELESPRDGNEQSRSDREDFDNTKHNEILPGSTPMSPRTTANIEDLYNDAHRSLQMEGNHDNITSGNAGNSTKSGPDTDSGYVTESNCLHNEQTTSQEIETRHTAEMAQTSNAINDSGYFPSSVGDASMSAAPTLEIRSFDMELLETYNVSHSDSIASKSPHITTHPHTLQSGYLPNTSEVVPTGMPSSYSSRVTPTNHEHMDALDEVDIRSGLISRDRYLGPATGYQVSSATLCDSIDTNHGYVCNDSREFSRSGGKAVMPLSLSLGSLSCNTMIENRIGRSTPECLTSGYVPNTCHAISGPISTLQLEDKDRGISTSIMGPSNVMYQNRETMKEHDLPLYCDNEATATLYYEINVPLPSAEELPQENYVRNPVFNTDIKTRTSCLSSSADNISMDLQSVDDSVIDTTEYSERFTPDCSQLEYEPGLIYPSESEAVTKSREGYICSDLTIASENVQFYFPYQKASRFSIRTQSG